MFCCFADGCGVSNFVLFLQKNEQENFGMTPPCELTYCMQLVGPILAEPPKELPSDLKSFLDRGLTGPGAVYVSMGTLARMNTAQLGSMAQALSALPNPILWKLNEAHLPGDPTAANLCCMQHMRSLDSERTLS